MNNKIKIFTANNQQLAIDIAQKLGLELGRIELTNFQDGEVRCRLLESVRGQQVFIIQSICRPVNDNLMTVMIMADALKRAGAKTIHAIIPYLGYCRQDRMAEARTPISAKVVAKMLSNSGIDQITTMELHASQIQGFFDITVDNLYTTQVFADYIHQNYDNFMIASPDVGGAARARQFANLLGCGKIAIVDKHRPRANQSEVMNVIGDVKGKNVVIFDDIIDTAGTISKASTALKQLGALRVVAVASHAVLSGSAYDNIKNSDLDEVVVSDSIPLTQTCDKIKVISASDLLATAINRFFVKQM